MENNSLPLYNSKKSGIVFSLSAILPIMLTFLLALTVQIIAASKNVSMGLSITELYNRYVSSNWFIFASFFVSQFSFFIIIMYFKKYQGISPINIVRGKFNYKYIVIGLFLSFGMIFGLSFVNDYFIKFLNLFGIEPAEVSIPTLNSAFNYITAIFIIALLPAIFEELLFRGILLKGILNLGTAQAVLSCGILFAIFHQNPSQTVYQFINGVVFALVALRAGSVIPTMIMHFINNAYILTVYYFIPEFEFTGVVKYILIVIALLIFVFSLIFLIFFDKSNSKKKTEDSNTFFKYSAFGIILCVFLWIAGLFL